MFWSIASVITAAAILWLLVRERNLTERVNYLECDVKEFDRVVGVIMKEKSVMKGKINALEYKLKEASRIFTPQEK